MKEVGLESYFKTARTWAEDNFDRVSQSRQRYQLAFLSAMFLNIFALIAIDILVPCQKLLPLLVHHYDNGITTVETLTQDKMPSNRAQVESDIFRYIQHRESFDLSSYRTQFELVHLLSNTQVTKEYLVEQDRARLDSPLRSLGESSKRDVHIYSIQFLDSLLDNEKDLHKDHHNLAEVVFRTSDIDKNSGKQSEKDYVVLISWRYVKPSDSLEVRWNNWDGFEVTRYSKEARSLEKV